MSNTKTTQTTSPKRTYNKKKDTVLHMDSISFRIGDSTTKTTLQPAFQNY
ncbi:hypothetical protein [Photobacterium leiognathi]|nr:hypothetical protein [Photobacterium leiognathi]